jgi:Putative Actinobacterial Holin-X, holin superfamily III
MTAGPGAQGQDSTSVGGLLSEVASDLTTLMRQEIELAKAEAKQSARRAGSGAGLFGAAGTAAVLALVFLSVAAWWAIGEATGRGWSGLIVAAYWAVVAAALALAGRQQVREMRGMPRTTETARRIPDAMRGKDE